MKALLAGVARPLRVHVGEANDASRGGKNGCSSADLPADACRSCGRSGHWGNECPWRAALPDLQEDKEDDDHISRPAVVAEDQRRPRPVQGVSGSTAWTYRWTIDAAKIQSSTDQRIVSPKFEICFGEVEPTIFALVLQAGQRDQVKSRGRQSFRATKGGRVSIKCEEGPLAAATLGVIVWMERAGHTCCEPHATSHNFRERSSWEHAGWKFPGGAPASGRDSSDPFVVGVQLTLASEVAAQLQLVEDPRAPPGLESSGAYEGSEELLTPTPALQTPTWSH